MNLMLVPLPMFQPDRSPLKLVAPLNMPPMLATWPTFQLDTLPLKVGPIVSNMACMVVTLPTFQPDMSPLKLVAPRNV